MPGPFSRTELLIGIEALEKLKASHVAIFGLGGVGGYAAEALARSGIGSLDLIDDDKICLTNINRQIYATTSSVGKYKVDAAKERIEDINPSANVTSHKIFFLPETASQFDFKQYDYVVDAIDTVSGKLALIEKAHEEGVPIISSMGAGNKMDPAAFEVADIYETSVCPLAKVMRKELKQRGIEHLKVVYSKEPAIKPDASCAKDCNENCICPPGTQSTCAERRQIPGSNSFVPPVAGLIMAGEVIKDITRINNTSTHMPKAK